MSCFSFQPWLVLVRSLLLALHTCAPLCALYLYFPLSSTEQLCSFPPSVCLSLSLRLSLPLYLSPVSSSETSGAKLCLSLSLHFSLFFCLFLNLSQLFFFLSRLSDPQKSIKERGRAYSKSCFLPQENKKKRKQEFFCFFLKSVQRY